MRLREHAWGLGVALVALFLFLALYLETPAARVPEADGAYTWLYTRSLVYDHDIDFTDDYALCGDRWHYGVNRGTGKPDNSFYVGPSVIWVPLLSVARLFVHFPADTPPSVAGACKGPLPAIVLASGPVLGAVTVLLLYFIARRVARARTAALTAALLGLGSPAVAYFCEYPSYSHAYDTFWVALLVLLSLRAAERPSALRWAIVGVVLGVCLLQRPVSLAFGAIPAALALERYRGERRRLAVAIALVGVGALACGVVPQALIYKTLYGRYWVGAPHSNYYLNYAHAHPLLTLFAPHGGLFFQTPILWLSLFGLRAMWRGDARMRAMLVASLVACALVVYASSAVLDWDSSGTFGSRRQSSLLGVLALPTAFALERIRAYFVRRPDRARLALALAVAIPTAFVTLGGAYGLHTERLSYRGMTQEHAYGGAVGGGFAILDKEVGDVAVLPAALVWRLRYGVPMTSFRDGTEAVYIRDFRRMNFVESDVPILEPRFRELTPGFERRDDGLTMIEPKAKIVFSAQWPFATHLRIHVTTSRATTLRIGSAGLFSTVWFPDTAIAPNDSPSRRLRVPPGGFDSGVNEIVFECADAAEAGVIISALGFDDDTRYPPPL